MLSKQALYVRDHKGEAWVLRPQSKPQRSLHKGAVHWTMWWSAMIRPRELRMYAEIPLPIFTDWWTS